jgi:hypothetical protein
MIEASGTMEVLGVAFLVFLLGVTAWWLWIKRHIMLGPWKLL